MGLVDELNKLSDLHTSGQLTDTEFEDAKTKLIRDFTGTGGAPDATGGDTAGGMATSVIPDAPAPEQPAPGTFEPTTTVAGSPTGAPPPPVAAVPGAFQPSTTLRPGPPRPPG